MIFLKATSNFIFSFFIFLLLFLDSNARFEPLRRAMPVDEGDDERWAELPGGGGSDEEGNSDSEDEGAIVDNICSLSADDGAAGTLLYQLPALSSVCRTLSISHDSTQGLAARVWPSAAMLVEFIAAEVEREKEREKEKEKERERNAKSSVLRKKRNRGRYFF